MNVHSFSNNLRCFLDFIISPLKLSIFLYGLQKQFICYYNSTMWGKGNFLNGKQTKKLTPFQGVARLTQNSHFLVLKVQTLHFAVCPSVNLHLQSHCVEQIFSTFVHIKIFYVLFLYATGKHTGPMTTSSKFQAWAVSYFLIHRLCICIKTLMTIGISKYILSFAQEGSY